MVGLAPAKALWSEDLGGIRERRKRESGGPPKRLVSDTLNDVAVEDMQGPSVRVFAIVTPEGWTSH